MKLRKYLVRPCQVPNTIGYKDEYTVVTLWNLHPVSIYWVFPLGREKGIYKISHLQD